MSDRAKQTCLLILAQAACVGVGLWMQHRHTASSLHRALEDAAWRQIELNAQEISGELDRLAIADQAAESAEATYSRELLQRSRSNQVGVLVVDTRRCVLVHMPHGDPNNVARLSPGKPIPWLPVSEPPNRGGALERGTLDLADGPHIAVCHALSAGGGYLLVHHPVAAIESEFAAHTRLLPATLLVALFWTLAVLTITSVVILGRIHERAEQQRARSTSGVLRQAQSLLRTRDAVIFGLAKLAESRDDDTGEHLERISAYATILASVLGRHPKYGSAVTPGFVRLIGISAALHDIGKVGIEDEILLKRGPLSAAENARMQTHALIGGQCLREIEQRLGTSNFLQMARKIALGHHERWDGKGYPKGLAGDAIPLEGRIVAIADVYDALSSKRVYKPAIPHEKCVGIIRGAAGKQFDPDLVEVWLALESRYRDVARRYATSLRTTGETGGGAPVLPEGHDEQAPAWAAKPPDDDVEASVELSTLA